MSAQITIEPFSNGATLCFKNVSGYSTEEKSKTVAVFLGNEELEQLRQLLPKPAKETALLDKATEALLSRLIGERIEAQMALRALELTGFKCDACGVHTRIHR